MNIVLVGLGGALGAILIGFVVGMLSHGKITKNQSLFLKTGVWWLYNFLHVFT